MATYAIGDVQGCFTTLERLLARIAYKPSDRLLLVGDLVNRGPRSLDVLRWAMGQGDRVVSVLGNHDIHLLASAAGLRKKGKLDTLDAILAAPDREALLRWVRTRPLLHVEGQIAVVHAALWPTWSIAESLERAALLQELLATDGGLTSLYDGATPTRWAAELTSLDARRADLAVFTRLRTIGPDGAISKFNGAPDDAPAGEVPWYAVPDRAHSGHMVLFGHWAAHDLVLDPPSHIALDSGCVWGRSLSAVRLEDLAVFQEPAADGAVED
jgi:bis(5'-nucleosyl)-tetraphosphatase (symmetrical)